LFVCPKCGYRDEPCWKAHRYSLYVVYCRLDELEPFRPDLAKRLQLEKDLDDGPYTYHLTKTGYVLRVPRDLKAFMYDRSLIERYKRGLDSRQQQLEL